MGEKKQKEERSKKIKKILIVGVCVLFAAIMIVSSTGTGWITGLAPVKAGDTVVLDYTLYNANGKAIITSDQQVYNAEIAKGNNQLVQAQQLSITANQSPAKEVYPVTVSMSGGSTQQFAIFAPEFSAISQGVIGMKDGDKKTIDLPSMGDTTEDYPAALLARQNLSVSDFRLGDLLPMGVSSDPSAMQSNSTAITYLRVARVTNISTQDIVVDFGYPSADISIVSINGR